MSLPEKNFLVKMLKRIAQGLKDMVGPMKKNSVQIPLELVSEILSRLPIKDVIRYQSVCKSWRDEINTTRFFNAHTIKSNKANSCNSGSYIFLRISDEHEWVFLDFSPASTLVEVKKLTLPPGILNLRSYFPFCSCNGLLCFTDFMKDSSLSEFKIVRFLLYNPATGSHKKTPYLVPKQANRDRIFRIGFGYDFMSDDYKILCLVCYHNSYLNHEASVEAWVYSSKTNSWKTIQPLHYDEILFQCFDSVMSFSNNALHSTTSLFQTIMSFDLGTEKFHKIPLPTAASVHDSDVQRLIGLRGCLHLVTPVRPHGKTQYHQIWVMTKYRVQWTKLVRIKFHYMYADKIDDILPFAYSKDGKEILIAFRYNFDPTKFIRCDLRSGKLKKLIVSSVPNDNFTAVPFDYFSLISPI